MSTVRQSELFASKDWTILYTAFNQVNFNASDPGSINQALRDYLRVNYPEDYNDWIESSEFVAIIDLLAWLAGTLAFKTDINARENFLETAEARESVLRLARFLSYNPSRNRCASGLLKLVEVSTNDDITDSTGQSLNNVRIAWNNNDDPDWFEKFSTVISAACIGSNPFGTPIKNGTVGGVTTQLYRLDSRMGDNLFGFTAPVSGQSMDFEICNADFSDGEFLRERSPDEDAAFHLYYRNDGQGNNSPDTGFFLLFKQGTLKKSDFNIDSPSENAVLEVPTTGVNETDVWVHSLDSNGRSAFEWTRVPAIFSENITFNSLANEERNIFSVVTRSDDRIAVRFADGLFGFAPSGGIRVWHRQSNGAQYQIKPNEINRFTQHIVYYNRQGIAKTLTMKYSLAQPVSNSAARETEEQIKQRAPSVYAAQNRMVSGEDYNVFPLSANIATKLKAVNRVYSGHSRHIDLNDPTSNYQDVTVFAEDGILYKETANYYEEVPLSFNRTPAEVIELHIQPILRKLDIRSYVTDELTARIDPDHPHTPSVPAATWLQSSVAKFSSTGRFTVDHQYLRAGTSIFLLLPDGTQKWVGIANVSGKPNDFVEAGLRGPVTLSEAVPTGATLEALVPGYNPELGEAIIKDIAEKLALSLSFTLWFDPKTSEWLVGAPSSLLVDGAAPEAGAIKIASVDYVSGTLWRLTARGKRFVFESERKVKFFHTGAKVLDSETGITKRDTVTILKSNSDLKFDDGRGLGTDFDFNLTNLFYYNSGTHEPRRVQIDFTDTDRDGIADHPDALTKIITPGKQSTLFWKLGEAFGQESYIPIRNMRVYDTQALRVAEPVKSEGRLAYEADTKKIYKIVNGVWVLQNSKDFKVASGRGPNVAEAWITASGTVTPERSSIYFQWKHYAPTNHRIDPALTNIVDVFVLPNDYDFAIRQWITNGAHADDEPPLPSELDLKLAFREYERFKMFSDQMVWRPVQYKYLFGPGSEKYNLRAKFKVVKLPNSALSDGEIKTRLIAAVNTFFDVTRWDFGETFFFTELAAFIHQQLASVIGSVVIVPMDEEASFGEVFEVKASSNEMFISTAQVSDVEIINSNTSANLRIR